MAPWGSMQRQLMAYLARHPQFQKSVKHTVNRFVNNPSVQKIRRQGQSTFTNAFKKSFGETKQDNATKGSPHFSWFNSMKRGATNKWYKQRNKIFTFFAANFMTILLAFQFSDSIWRMMKAQYKQLTSSPDESAQKKHSSEKVRQNDNQIERQVRIASASGEESTPAAHKKRTTVSDNTDAFKTSSSSGMFDDTLQKDSLWSSKKNKDTLNSTHREMFVSSKDGTNANFETSFLVKMGDETEFTSSLARENLTGNISSH